MNRGLMLKSFYMESKTLSSYVIDELSCTTSETDIQALLHCYHKSIINGELELL